MINIWYTTVKRNIFWLCWILLLTNRLGKFFHFWNFFKILFSVFLMFDVRDVGIMNQLSNTDRTSNFWIFWCVSKNFFLNISSSVFGASHSLAVSWLCNRNPLYTSQDIEKVAKYSHNEISLFQWRFYSIRFLSSEKCPTESVFILKVTLIL